MCCASGPRAGDGNSWIVTPACVHTVPLGYFSLFFSFFFLLLPFHSVASGSWNWSHPWAHFLCSLRAQGRLDWIPWKRAYSRAIPRIKKTRLLGKLSILSASTWLHPCAVARSLADHIVRAYVSVRRRQAQAGARGHGPRCRNQTRHCCRSLACREITRMLKLRLEPRKKTR